MIKKFQVGDYVDVLLQDHDVIRAKIIQALDTYAVVYANNHYVDNQYAEIPYGRMMLSKDQTTIIP